MTTSNNIDNQCVSNIVGFNETFSVLNNNAAANLGSAATIIASVNGAAVGDPVFQSLVSGVQTWSFGADNSDGDRFKVSNGATLGTNDCIQINTAGAPGSINYPLQPRFFARLSGIVNNITGFGPLYKTIVFDNVDINVTNTGGYSPLNGIFTAPVTGSYLFSFNIQTTTCTTASECRISLLTPTGPYYKMIQRAASGYIFSMENSILTYLTTGDTAQVQIRIQGEAGDTDGVFSDGGLWTYFSGMFVG
jgi:hypothetical protein